MRLEGSEEVLHLHCERRERLAIFHITSGSILGLDVLLPVSSRERCVS